MMRVRKALFRRLQGQGRRVLRDMGIPYTYGEIPDLGTSTGDIMWNGTTLMIEDGCDAWWIFHEIAHYIEASIRGAAHLRNWGFEENLPDDFLWEEAACGWTIVLFHALHWPKWLIADVADEINAFTKYGEHNGYKSKFSQSDYEEWVRDNALKSSEHPALPREIRDYLRGFTAGNGA